ncbi:hypothetical protein N7495_008638 [Penicillium taxi]|uniref:uncharacterized protein n=1 Tax=Penicillium taxi TaxID=168475 RepID=UPI0025456E6E|nr:uncharacterized protein N7495_008638 [Penicillium taxi]KAJ5888597.1 hypothetical protein N7495_008638 [Penicillium taxi]
MNYRRNCITSHQALLKPLIGKIHFQREHDAENTLRCPLSLQGRKNDKPPPCMQCKVFRCIVAHRYLRRFMSNFADMPVTVEAASP